MKRIRTSQIGLGKWGQKVLARVSELSQFEFVGIADRSSRELDVFASKVGASPFRSWDELIQFYIPDLVLIATPLVSHLDLAAKALQQGCHVWLTKPVVSLSSDLEKLKALALEKNRRIFFDHTYIFNPQFQRIAQALEKTGLPQKVESYRGHHGGWQKGSTALEELIYHDIYIAMAWMKCSPKTVSYKVTPNSDPRLQEEFLSLIFPAGQEFKVFSSLGWTERRREMKISTASGEISWTENDLETNFASPLAFLDFDAIQTQFLDIAKALIDGVEPKVGFQQASDTLKVIEFARLSNQRGGALVSYE